MVEQDELGSGGADGDIELTDDPGDDPSDGSTGATPGGENEPGFSAAMSEIEGILRRIEGDETDIDRLASELERAAELLEICRAKIRKAEVEVHQIVDRLEP